MKFEPNDPKPIRGDLVAALEMLRSDADRDSEEYPIRSATMTCLFDAYGEKDLDRIEHYVGALWHEVPAWWLALTVKRLLAQRVYSTPPTPGDVRREARELAGMERPVYIAGTYQDAPRRKWPPPGKRHAVTEGEYERLPAGESLQLPGGGRPQIEGGENEA